MEKQLTSEQKQTLLSHFYTFITPERQQLFEKIIEHRTRHLTVVLEDIFQPHNASAVLRTCDCFGLQDVHIIENENPYKVNPDVALGASQWLNLIRYNNQTNSTQKVYEKLKSEGYQIIATMPHKNDVMLDELPIDNKTALVFGTELRGLSPEAIALADGWVKIPMYGFTESFNISVAASISLYHLTHKLRNSTIPWQLTSEERLDIKLDWVKQTIKRSDLIEQEFLKFL